jgi:hypothetical protein
LTGDGQVARPHPAPTAAGSNHMKYPSAITAVTEKYRFFSYGDCMLIL